MGNLEHAAQCYLAALQIRPNFPQARSCTFDQPCRLHMSIGGVPVTGRAELRGAVLIIAELGGVRRRRV